MKDTISIEHVQGGANKYIFQDKESTQLHNHTKVKYV